MTYETVSKLHGKKFRRIVGVQEGVFKLMVETVTKAKTEKRKHPTKGQQSPLSIENQVLLVCLFWREYRGQEHIAMDFGVHQSTVSRIIKDIEQILIRSGQFSLPGKRTLGENGKAYEVVIVDVTEIPVQRPKKNKSTNTAKRKSDTR